MIGIIADDLTSAADGASPFMLQGRSINVYCGNELAITTSEKDVIAIDCKSRSMPLEQAFDAVSNAVTKLPEVSLLFKTIDSTLRGHIRAEILAAYQASHCKRVVVAPAFPDAGRTTQAGQQFVYGCLVSQSNYAKNPVHPATTANIADLIDPMMSDVEILDATTQQELNKKVADIALPHEVLWVGSPGLAIALAARLKKTQLIQLAKLLPLILHPLVVVGSANSVSQTQVKNIPNEFWENCLSAPIERIKTPEKVLEELTIKALKMIKQGGYDALIATGGDTMEALLTQLKVNQFALVGEIEPGFPVGIAQLPNGYNLPIALKAGGFGAPDALVNAIKKLKNI